MLRFGAGDLAAALAPALARRTGGNPLFVSSLVDYFVAEGDIIASDDGWRLARGGGHAAEGMPRDLHEMIARRIDRLSRDEQRLLEAASALGAERRSSPRASPNGQTAPARGATPSPTPSYQEVLYERLAPLRRVVLHRALGETLEWGYEGRTSEIATALALHFEAGGELAKAARYLAEAAEASVKQFSAREADAYLTRALGLNERLRAGEERLRARLRLLHQRGWTRRAGGDLLGASPTSPPWSSAPRRPKSRSSR